MSAARNSAVKFLSALLCAASITVGTLSLLAGMQIAAYGGYGRDREDFVNVTLNVKLFNDICEVSEYYSLLMNGQSWTEQKISEYENQFASENSDFFFTVADYDTGEVLLNNYRDAARYSISEDFYITAADYYNYWDGYSSYSSYGVFYSQDDDTAVPAVSEFSDVAMSDEDLVPLDSGLRHVMITGYVRAYPVLSSGKYAQLIQLGYTLYDCRNQVIIAAAASAVVFLVLFLFLMYGAGRRAHTDGITLRFADRIPWDLFLAIAAGLVCLGVLLFFRGYEDYFYGPWSPNQYVILGIDAAAASLLFMLVTMSFAARLKTKDWYKNSLIYLFFHWSGEVLHHPLRRLYQLILSIPLVWKTLLFGLVMVAAEIFCLYYLYWNSFVFPLVLLNILFALVVLSAVVSLKKLQKAGRAIADGDLDYRVDTSLMYLDYKAHGEDLNRISSGIAVAVEERLKSERFKTELITNVSHDLKTPLTSIVNYVDLLSKLELPEDARAYVEVLQRQSARLKKLTEDLVDASKASTGNLSVEITSVNLGELVSQVTGEYEERFEKSGLSPVLIVPEETVYALGDGRYLWRIMDNLLSNVCKYALSGTRVYIDATAQDGRAVLSIKNISRDRLNVTADELMERFVRGDASRNTEGSGLGLSIAQSLAELMSGKLSITVDGDLFKVELNLPIAPREPSE